MEYSYRCGKAGCGFEFSSELRAWARREGWKHQLHAHGENPPDPWVVDTLITRTA